jgi:ferric iron reductase protein FhuF
VPGTLRAAVDAVADIGPFFAATANPAEAVDDSWRPTAELYADPEPLSARIEQVAWALGTDERRVAASITYQGLAARLVSPLLAVASVTGLVPPWSPATLHWRRAVTGPWPLWESADDAVRPPAADLPAAVAEVLVEPHLVALASAVRGLVGISARTLAGNAASSVVSAGRMVAQARPEAAGTASALVDALLGSPALAGSGTWARPWSLRRASCCLYYRVPGGGLCGDCVLIPRRAHRTIR